MLARGPVPRTLSRASTRSYRSATASVLETLGFLPGADPIEAPYRATGGRTTRRIPRSRPPAHDRFHYPIAGVPDARNATSALTHESYSRSVVEVWSRVPASATLEVSKTRSRLTRLRSHRARQADGCCWSDLSGGCRLVRWRGGPTTYPSSRPPSTSGTRAMQQRRPAEAPTRSGPARRAGGSRRGRRATRSRRAAGVGTPRKTRAGSGRMSSSSPGDAYPGPERITLETELSVVQATASSALTITSRVCGPPGRRPDSQLRSRRSSRVASSAISECPSRPS
jgi:hypothetical protein